MYATKEAFTMGRDTWKTSKEERWDYIRETYSKLARIRPYKKGTYINGLIRTAIVTIPSSITMHLCRDDLAMIVAGSHRYASYRVSRLGTKEVVSSPEDAWEFQVTVIMDIQDPSQQ
jgi:hypothetical protein